VCSRPASLRGRPTQSSASYPSGSRSCDGCGWRRRGTLSNSSSACSEVARQFVGAERAEAEGRLDQYQVLDPDRGALTQILAEFAPPGTPVIVEPVVEEIDAIVKPIRGSPWQESQPGDREVRRRLRLVLKNNGLPPDGDLFSRAYDYIRAHY
jgi:type I restriction enzyme R subunit